MTKLLCACALVAILAPMQHASAQIAATISGRITDVAGEPVPSVNVFIASSMNGTVTDSDGWYQLSGIPLGTLRLYVSIIGFKPHFEDVFIKEARVYTYDFQLEEAIYEFGAITVTADNRRWKRQLERFTRIFIGETPNAAQTKIVNPEVLDFSGRGGEFRAQASEPLIIENEALGYRITYYLNEFVAEPMSWRWDGEPLFESMEAQSPEMAAQWHAKRDSAFYGSFRHFLLATLNNQVEEQGFKMYSRTDARTSLAPRAGGGNALTSNQRFPVRASEIIKPGQGASERILDFQGFIEIVYTHEVETKAFLRHEGEAYRRPKFQTSLIRLDKGPTIVDLKGDALDPYGVTFYGGYFAYERIADDIPKEYRP